jgi:tRNA threonylcarbamoyladenosine biosynthesis protein TsaE
MTIRTASAAATEEVGRRLGARCHGGELIGLVGDLGAGKTCLVRGIAAGLGIDPGCVVSPTFTLVAEYSGRLPLVHIDLYRLDRRSLDDAWLREYLFGPGVAVVEWFERLDGGVDEEHLRIALAFGQGDERHLAFLAAGSRHTALLRGFEASD